MGFDFSSENLSSQIPILSDKVYVSDFCVSNMDSHVIVSLVLSHNVSRFANPRSGLPQAKTPKAAQRNTDVLPDGVPQYRNSAPPTAGSAKGCGPVMTPLCQPNNSSNRPHPTPGGHGRRGEDGGTLSKKATTVRGGAVNAIPQLPHSQLLSRGKDGHALPRSKRCLSPQQLKQAMHRPI